MKQPKVDLRKRHPWDADIKKAIVIGCFGVLVELAAIGEFIYFHDYQAAFNMVIALLVLAFALRAMIRIRQCYPLSIWDAWIQKRVNRLQQRSVSRP